MVSPLDSAYQFFPCLVKTQLSRLITSTQYFTTSVSLSSARLRRIRSFPISVVWIRDMFSNKSFMMVRKYLINEGASRVPAPTNYNFDIESKFLSLKIFFPYLIAGFILSGIVGSARLYLKSHSDSQIYAGFAVGFIIPLLIYNLL